jgi:RNA polymerase sigma-70 factor (ECF subfamily)
MGDCAERLSSTFLTMEPDLELEFETRLVESSTLAFRVAYGVLRNREDAEDVAQEAFARAYRSFAKLRDRHRFRAWLVRVTWRLAIDRQRSDRRRVLREMNHSEPPCEPPEDPVARERAGRLWRAIDMLPEHLRIVTVLAGIEEYNIREVALVLRLPEGTVKSRLFHARRRLKELLQ